MQDTVLLTSLLNIFGLLFFAYNIFSVTLSSSNAIMQLIHRCTDWYKTSNVICGMKIMEWIGVEWCLCLILFYYSCGLFASYLLFCLNLFFSFVCGWMFAMVFSTSANTLNEYQTNKMREKFTRHTKLNEWMKIVCCFCCSLYWLLQS